MSIIEKALEKLDDDAPAQRRKPDSKTTSTSSAPVAEPYALSLDDAAGGDEARVDAAAPAVATASALAQPSADSDPLHTEPNSTSRRVDLDLARLEQIGFLTPNQAQSLVAEEYRLLKRPLLRRATPSEAEYVDDGNLIIATSSLPGEGKTYMSINLAMSMAMEVDKTVLLVDADVAKADVSRMLGVQSEKGLSSYLSGRETDLSKLILRTNVEKLALLPAGPHYSKLTELLASEQMKRLVRELAERYPDRIVVFDSPPLLATSGASVLTSLMGQVLMVVEAVRTPKSAVKAALRQMAGARNVNFVLNKQRRKAGGYGYYGYGYGYGQTYAYGNRPTEG